ncbi:type VI secretion system ATPase TssH [Kangiella profundi]|uniref:Type VI secretion system ATPase TssH n=1 Tax=Kangiella profundi TaxID=1561924 RepID=A0A2K9ABT8_9GAMM|nr:type VI secretion system ATPase TssH [Kangiella profundi]AUD77836.1 type VI secretion system ATPase TssH [Kangiella profundi]GGE92105.1 ClpV1 family T6SS ATPase [Kangiella profundi]
MANTEIRNLIEKLNDECKSSLEKAVATCFSKTHYYVEIQHWLIELLKSETNDVHEILKYFAVNSDLLEQDILQAEQQFKTGNGHAPALSEYLMKMIQKAWVSASINQQSTSVRSGHLFLVLCNDDSLAFLMSGMSKELSKIDCAELEADFTSIVSGSSENISSQTQETAAKKAGSQKALEQYTIDLTQQAQAGELDPVLGRENEVRQMIDILTRRRQNNPILTGEAGVGKTAVVEGLAQKIISKEVPEVLHNVSIRVLDMGLLQAGAGVKGEFENRLKQVIADVKSSIKPVILFIDEAHTMIGAGGAEGQNDAANLLKPALARGELRVIAATTWAEYKKFFEKDAALSRRFQVVKVEEPDVNTAIDIMRGVSEVMAKHHKVHILDEALTSSVLLSQRYIPSRQLPDKSVSLLDTACARVNLSQNAKPALIEASEKSIESWQKELAICEMEATHEERIAELKALIEQEQKTLQGLNEKWQAELAIVKKIHAYHEQEDKKPEQLEKLRAELVFVQQGSPMVFETVNEAVIAAIVSDWTGIPVGKMKKQNINQVLELEEQLTERVRGQDLALKSIAQSMRVSAAKLMDPNKPRGVFILAGPSGVGKTETALALAETLYGSERNVITINMSEFKEEHKVSLLMGSPPGYIGYGEGGILTEAVRRNPYSVILLDEMEKAHPGVQEVFFQVFDKGMMKDGEGRDIDFKNSVILMTTNAGTETMMDYSRLEADDEEEIVETSPEQEYEELTQVLHQDLLRYFKPAFLGRTTLLAYKALEQDILRDITKIQLARVSERVKDSYKVSCTFADELIENIVERCTETDSGARNIQKIIQQNILPQISNYFLTRLLQEDELKDVVVLLKDGELEISTESYLPVQEANQQQSAELAAQ